MVCLKNKKHVHTVSCIVPGYLSDLSLFIRRLAVFLRYLTPVSASSAEAAVCPIPGLAAPFWAGVGLRSLCHCHWST